MGCGSDKGDDADPRQGPSVDGLLLADLTTLTRAPGGGWRAGPTGATASVLYATAAVQAKLAPVGDRCLIYQGLDDWQSEQGLSPITLSSSQQTVSAAFAEGHYRPVGLSAQAAYIDGDRLTVSSVALSEVPAPVGGDPAQVLGDPAGLATAFRAPEGFAMMIARFEAAGDAGGTCWTPTEAMGREGTTRTAPLLPGEMVAEIQTRGLQPTTVLVGYFNLVEAPAFFPGRPRPIWARAGRVFRVDPAALN
jgi:hypothetical protein